VNPLLWFDRLHKAGMVGAALPFAGLVGGESVMAATNMSHAPYDVWIGMGGVVLIDTSCAMLAIFIITVGAMSVNDRIRRKPEVVKPPPAGRAASTRTNQPK
jgi:hypothetical protein